MGAAVGAAVRTAAQLDEYIDHKLLLPIAHTHIDTHTVNRHPYMKYNKIVQEMRNKCREVLM